MSQNMNLRQSGTFFQTNVSKHKSIYKLESFSFTNVSKQEKHKSIYKLESFSFTNISKTRI